MKEAPDDLKILYAAYYRLFRTANGKIVLADLRRRYMEGELRQKGEMIEDTLARAAKHDVIQAIIDASSKELQDD